MLITHEDAVCMIDGLKIGAKKKYGNQIQK